jgi:hypothetical protein
MFDNFQECVGRWHLVGADISVVSRAAKSWPSIGDSSIRVSCGLHKRDRWPDVRFGSLADITARSRHVRFIPDSGHSLVHLECPKSAISRYAYGEVNSASGAYGPGPDSALLPLRRPYPAETPCRDGDLGISRGDGRALY